MKHMSTAVVLTLSLLVTPQMRAASPASATLTLPHDNILPGVPFDLVVTYTNVSDKPLTIDGARATLVVTFANGDTKVMMNKPGSEASQQWTIKGSMPVRLGPGKSVQHAASWEDGSIPNWLHNGSAFSGPGTYGIALDLQIYDEEQVLGTVLTPSVMLRRVEPVGIDAELWKRMQRMSGGRWNDGSFATMEAGVALANEIIQLHPSSGYYPYVVALRAFDVYQIGKNHIPVLLEAAERFPDSPAYPYLLAAAAGCARYEGLKAKRAGDIAEGKKYLTLAESKYRQAVATKSVAIRKSSELGLRNVTYELDRATKKRPAR